MLTPYARLGKFGTTPIVADSCKEKATDPHGQMAHKMSKPNYENELVLSEWMVSFEVFYEATLCFDHALHIFLFGEGCVGSFAHGAHL